jgi:hypothetical protein
MSHGFSSGPALRATALDRAIQVTPRVAGETPEQAADNVLKVAKKFEQFLGTVNHGPASREADKTQ